MIYSQHHLASRSFNFARKCTIHNQVRSPWLQRCFLRRRGNIWARCHYLSSSGEKPHVCDTCRKGFSTSSSLNTHRRIHSGERPHECPTCGKRFTASSNLYYHRMTHTKVRHLNTPYQTIYHHISRDTCLQYSTRVNIFDHSHLFQVYTVKASNFGPHENFGPFLARSIASLGEFCAINK
jgi:hypothetical protein